MDFPEYGVINLLGKTSELLLYFIFGPLDGSKHFEISAGCSPTSNRATAPRSGTSYRVNPYRTDPNLFGPLDDVGGGELAGVVTLAVAHPASEASNGAAAASDDKRFKV